MPAGALRKPLHALALTGELKNHPGRYADRANEPKNGRTLSRLPPDGFTKPQREAWYKVIDSCYPGTIFHEDRIALEEFAKVVAALQTKGSHPPALHTRFFRFVTMFGLSPADRSRISLNSTQVDDNPFKEFDAA